MANWRRMGRLILKTALLFLLLNFLFTLLPREAAGAVSLYNTVYPGRPRLPYGENPAQSYNLTLNSIPAMFASHRLSRPKAAGEFRIILLGDSGTWGWFLENEDTLAGQLNRMNLAASDGRQVVIYNLGYPIMSLSKDLLLLDEAMSYDPDLILWPVTLESFAPEKQLEHPLLQHNPERLRRLIDAYQLRLNRDDPRFVAPGGWAATLVGQRRALADWLRLQQVGLAWSATGVDQAIPAQIPLRQSDFDADESWHAYNAPTQLAAEELAFDVLRAGMVRAGNVPVLLINEPIFISHGRNSHLRYNLWYPRWAYDQYRELLAATAAAQNWPYLDLWDAVPAAEFSDSPVHLTPAGAALFAGTLREPLTAVLP